MLSKPNRQNFYTSNVHDELIRELEKSLNTRRQSNGRPSTLNEYAQRVCPTSMSSGYVQRVCPTSMLNECPQRVRSTSMPSEYAQRVCPASMFQQVAACFSPGVSLLFPFQFPITAIFPGSQRPSIPAPAPPPMTDARFVSTSTRWQLPSQI